MSNPEMKVLKRDMKLQTQDASGKNQRAIRATIIGVTKQANTVHPLEEAPPGQSKELTEDPFEALSRQGQVIEPPFDLLTLAMLPEHNSELNPCVEAMEVNIEGFGYRFVPRVKLDQDSKIPDEIKRSVKKERVFLENFFMYVSMEDSFTALRRKVRKDLETTGNAYLEVIRNMAGKIQGFNHIPSYQMRLARMEATPIKIKVPILELQEDGSVQVQKVEVWQRFRRIVQSRAVQMRNLSYLGGYKLRWFKEYLDPRMYDNETGEIVPSENQAALPEWKRANEILHLKIYSSRSPYGLPRFIGQLLSIFGDRAAEEINYTTFKNNNIPSMVVLVSNGQLTEGSIKRIESFVESAIQGSDNYSKFLILEAEGEEEGEDSAQIKMDIKPLVSEQHKDALFQNYSTNNQERVRRAFRLPPILVGRADDYTRATADTSRRLADEQVFAPERNEFDNIINRRIFPEMGIVYHRFKSNSPNTTDNTQLVKILGGAEKTGGMTPRIARTMLEDILGIELPEFPEGFDPDLPFSLLMAEAVKNKADPSEPGQQVTALKTLELVKSLTGGEEAIDPDEAILEHAITLNKALERKWRKELQQTIEDHTADLE